MDLISRADAIEAIFRVGQEHVADDVLPLGAVLDYIDAIKEVKGRDAEGHWTWHKDVKNIYGGKYIECSECGEKYMVQDIKDEKFCRNCGAKMEVTE